jgi:hypothetical protein
MIQFKKIAMALTVMACFAQPALADEHTDLLDILLQKGISVQAGTCSKNQGL